AESLELIFEGLDTYARVYLNDTLILEADNMFRTWSVEVKALLKRKNTLLVHFSAAESRAKKDAGHLSYTLPEGWRSFTRKAQYQYGWDWAPKILTCGIWKPVSLVARGRRTDSTLEKPGAATPAELISFRVKQLADSSALTKAQASVRIWSAGNRKATLLISCKGFPTQVLHEVNLRKGSQEVLVPFLFPDAKKWEISGRGEPHLYTFQCTLAADQSDTLSSVTGFRDATLLRFPDSTGESFGFRINGRDVFARGANLVPPDIFPSRVPDSVYHALVAEAKAAGMNMLRVWGGGYYLPDVFYDYCDRYGIMVWQDFMFACSMVPGDPGFLENVRREAQEQVDRLSRHPSIVLWCGNNESDEGWHNWGWQKQYAYTPADSAKIWKDYQRLFCELLPAVLDSLDPGRPYLPSSPVWGWGRKESMQRGDSHYWGVWWGMEPFEAYRRKTGRFMSEYGFQSLPAVSAWKGIADTLSITARSLRHHQKHPRGFETISHYLENYFGVPADFGDYSYVSQLQQSYGMKIAMNAHRGHYPTCRGSLFWQWNDCWPSVSWSALDYRLQRKLFYDEARRAFDSLFVYTDAGERGLSTTVHFDGVDDVSLTIRLYYIRTDRVAEPISVDERSIRLKPDSILRDCIFYPANQMRNMDSTSMVFVTEAISNFTFSTLYRDYYHRCA
ncbi:MAG: glycoside hydrolase family 2 protein, partial [Bacteroidia bacterium]|nr:glycoside hydrolase family 2 protein [Bacteroidia bacterium]